MKSKKITKFPGKKQKKYVVNSNAGWWGSAARAATAYSFCTYGSPSSPSMVRTSTYSSASPTTDAAITADITRWKTSVRNKNRLPFSRAETQLQEENIRDAF